MSSWKTYGGIHNAENTGKISAQSLTVKKLILQEPYGGVFDICGGLFITGNTTTDSLTAKQNVSLGSSTTNNFTVQSSSDFYGPVVFHGNSETTGNIVSLQSFIANNNVYIGKALYFGNVNTQVQSIFYDTSGIGINQPIPNAALDISSNQPYSINVISSNRTNESVLVQNCSGQAITMGVDLSSAHIRFYYDVSFNSGAAVSNAFINYYSDGTLNLDVSKNVNVSSQMTISPYITNTHVNNETLTVYDISSGPYYPAIYGNSISKTGSAMTLVATDVLSNTFMNISTPAGKGLMVGGGAYAGDANRSVGIIGLIGNTNPSQVIVSGKSAVKYFSTTGVNTFQPRKDQYVLDVNGPVHIDNGDVTSVVQTPFQIYQLSIPKTNTSIGIAMGSSIDISKNEIRKYYRENLIRTTDYGQTWTTIDISNIFLSTCDALTSIQLIDANNCFLTGNASIVCSNNFGNSWQGISLANPNPFGSDSFIYNHITINPVPKISGNIYGYFAIDASSIMIGFEYDISNNKGQTASTTKINASQYINSINYIQVDTNSIYLAGNAIVKYNATNNTTPIYASSHVYNNYSYNQIKIYDNSYAIAVGNNIISSTVNGGQLWRDISFNTYGKNGVNFRSVHLIDASNAIAVGWYGNIWVSNNQGSSWNPIPTNLINASGKAAILLSNTSMFEDVFMPDINTILVVNTLQPYNRGGNVYGSSNIYNIFTPNYLNRTANVVMDISGILNVSGDLRLSDGGYLVSTNPSMNIFNTSVNNIQLGGDAAQITVGNAYTGNTTIRTNVIMNQNVSLISGNSLLSIAGRMNLVGNANISGNVGISGNLTVSGNTILNGCLIANAPSVFNNTLSINNSDLIVSTGNVFVKGIYPTNQSLTVGGPDNDIYIGSGTNSNRNPTIYIGQSDPYGGSNTNYSKIVIGGANDSVIIQGNTTILNIQQSAVQSATTAVNFPLVGQGANVTSAGAGIDIFDNSYAQLTINGKSSNVYGYMHVGSDMQSFVFKAPSYGALDPTTGLPALNTYGNIYRISPDNRVRLGVNQLTLSGRPNVKRAVVMLQSDTDFKNYQSLIGNSYNPNSVNPDADYVINLCGDFDISNILLKNFDTVAGSQTIGSNLTIGNTSVPSSLYVYGNLYSNNASFSKLLFPSGNIGIGTSLPQYPLDISGTARILGPLISTNYDGALFPVNYGSQWSDTGNTASAGSYFQDTAISYDGKYQYGLLYNKTGFGSVNVSSNYGSSWSSVSLPASYTGNIIYQAIPYLASNTQSFQFATLTVGEPSAQPLYIQAGTYIASASTNTNAYLAFDSFNATAWQTSSAVYTSTGVYSGIYNTTGLSGEWLQIQLPYSFILNGYKIYNSIYLQGPKNFYVFGSNDTNSWTIINNTVLTQGIDQSVSFNNSIAYSSYRVVVNSIFGTGNSAAAIIAKINLTGIVPNPTGAFSYSMATSGTGQTVLVANQGYIAGNGNLYLSNTYGQSFNDTGKSVTNGVWQGVAVSQTGLYQAAIGINRSGSSNIWLSSNSGSTWVSSIGVLNGWQSIAMNATGQYITAIQSGNVYVPVGNIWVSSTYGSSWSSNGNIYQYADSVSAFANEVSADFNKTVHISTNGQYQTVLGLGLNTDTLYGNANIWINSNYGQGAWTNSGFTVPVISGNVGILSSITMTGGGQYQIASYILNVIGGNSVTGSFIKSTDYGQTWSGYNFQPPTTFVKGNVYRGFFPKIGASINGQYIIGVTKYQDLSGNKYNNTNATATGIGNIFVSSVTAVNNFLESHYMGSSYSGNVTSTHGFKLTVPHVNRDSILMGYDVTWNSAYINSADQYSQNPLCLNPAGGPVGVGKINPGAYSLDVSGNVNFDGSVNIASLVVNSNKNSLPTFLGIGTTNPSYIVDISGGDIRIVGNTTGGILRFGSPQTAIIQSGSNDMTILNNSYGNLYLGTNNNNIAAISNTGVNIIGNLIIGSTVNSSGPSNGALVISGGVGVGGNIFSSGVITCGNIITTNSTSTINGMLINNGSITGPSTFAVNGISIFSGSMTGVKTITTSASFRSFIGGIYLYSYTIDASGSSTTQGATSFIGPVTFTTSGTSYSAGGAISNVTTITAASGTGVTINGSSGGVGVTVNSSGLVGIGTTTPAYPLDVSGVARIANNGAILILQSNNKSTNITVGYNSLNNTGSYNSAFGLNVLTNNTGSYNVAFGYGALAFNTSGQTNLAFGFQALWLNTTGSNNSVFGHNSMPYNNGSNNCAFGCLALGSATTCNNNCAFGYIALYNTTTGYNNSVFGTNAMTYSNGSNNCAFGYIALYYATTCFYNCAFGTQALFNATTGSNNSAFGYNSLSGTTTGSNNSAFGYNAFSTANSFSNSTAIGYNSQPTASNQVVLGTAAETVYMPGKVGIGTTSPTCALDVIGSTLIRNTTIYNASTAGWYNIGFWDCSTSANQGAKLKVRIMGQTGYNSNNVNGTQAGGETTIYLCNLNNLLTPGGVSNTTTVNVDGWWKHEGGNAPLSSIKVVQNGTNRYQYSIFANVLAYTQHCINAETSLGTVWTTTYNSVSDPGINSATVQLITNAYNVIGPNFGIGTASPAYPLDVAGIVNSNASIPNSYTYNNLPNMDGGTAYIKILDSISCLNIHNTYIYPANSNGNGRKIMINMASYGIANSSYNQYANFAIGAVCNTSGTVITNGTSLDINVGCAIVGTPNYTLITGMTIAGQSQGIAYVGINNQSPTCALDVNGSINASNVSIQTLTPSYSSLPTFTSSQIGYNIVGVSIYGLNQSITNITSPTNVITLTSVPIGVWLISWNFTLNNTNQQGFAYGLTNTNASPVFISGYSFGNTIGPGAANVNYSGSIVFKNATAQTYYFALQPSASGFQYNGTGLTNCTRIA